MIDELLIFFISIYHVIVSYTNVLEYECLNANIASEDFFCYDKAANQIGARLVQSLTQGAET